MCMRFWRPFPHSTVSLSFVHAGVSFNAKSNDDISRVTLPPSLFKSLRNQTSISDQPGLVFTSYSTALFFPLTQYEKTNSSRMSLIGSSVLGATVVSGQPATYTAVRNLTEPVVMEFRVNRSMVGIYVYSGISLLRTSELNSNQDTACCPSYIEKCTKQPLK